MSGPVRRIEVPAFAKLNLTLKVLHKRADNYHELRTVFQTISLHDTIEVEFRESNQRSIALESTVEIPGNIVLRAAELILDEMGSGAEIRFRLTKRIPMGGGLGGGSTNAAAVLLALPKLARRPVHPDRLLQIAAILGSDVPFFLSGGTALGLSRGEELYPFPEPAQSYGLLITPGIHVSTPEAYRALQREASSGDLHRAIPGFQAMGWIAGGCMPAANWGGFCQNDFEPVVIARYPELGEMRQKLMRQGAGVARMSGSGSSLFGFFGSEAQAAAALAEWPADQARLFHTVSRVEYESAWSQAFAG